MTMQRVDASFPDVELFVTDFLRDNISAGWIGNRVPNPRVDSMIVVRRDGGAISGVFDYPRLAVRCWAVSEEAATALADAVGRLLRASMPDGEHCTNVVQLTGPTPVADDSAQPLRYQLFELTMRSIP